MSNKIKTNPKHGLNITIPICFFCGKERNELMLSGKLNKDDVAPDAALVDYVPCEHCKSLMDQGITVIATQKTPVVQNQPPMQKDFYPTGNWCILSEQGFQHLCDIAEDKSFIEQARKTKIMFVEQELFDILFPDNSKQNDEQKEGDKS